MNTRPPREPRASEAFRIPFARSAAGSLVAPEDAEKGVNYTCPSCSAAVVLHAGTRKQRHYHHQVSACSAESVLHLSAKELVVRAVDAWRAGGPPPIFVRTCAEADCDAETGQPMPKKVRRAALEHRLGSGRVVDVGLLGVADLPIAAIEIHATHAVDEEKAFALEVPWIELEASDVCASRGHVLTARRDGFVPWLCERHASLRGAAAKDARDERKVRGALVRALPYRIEDFPGYRVDGVTTCPNGHAMLTFAWDGREPPWPRPPHVVAWANDEDRIFDASRSATRGVLGYKRRWASACATCGARASSGLSGRRA